MKQPLSLGELSRARHYFHLFVFFNVISFTLLSGNVLTLYVLRLEASSLFVGVLSSFLYLAFFCMLFGRIIVPKLGFVKTMGRFWLIRYLMMVPVLASPLFASRGMQDIALGLIILSVLGFNTARGIAITPYNTIVGSLASDKERGAFLSRIQVIVHAASLVLGVGLALALGLGNGLYIYAIFIAIGITTGLIAATRIFKLPEPESTARSFSENIWKGFRNALKRSAFRRFTIMHLLSTTCFFMIAPFLILYAKKVYLLPDNLVLYLNVCGSLGAVLMALISGFVIDKLGAKPLYTIFAGVLTFTAFLIVLTPQTLPATSLLILLAFIFFLHSMGGTGLLNAGQIYFFAAIAEEERLNLGIIYYLSQGLAGGIGSLLGGALIQGLQGFEGLEEAGVFRIYFGMIAFILLILLFLMRIVPRLGAYRVRNALAVIFSPRDLRAISLLHRLGKISSLSEERQTIQALAVSPSTLTIQEILQKLKSPRFSVRADALNALNTLPLDREVVRALLSEVKNHAFTTAHLAADIIGRRKVTEGVKSLRKNLHSKDYFLAAKCIASLARLDDRDSIPAIESIIAKTRNPRLIIHGAWAMELFQNPASLAILLHKLEDKSSPFLRDELILAMSGILEISDWFYPFYISFLESSTAGISRLRDEIALCPNPRVDRQRLYDFLKQLPRREQTNFTENVRGLLADLDIVRGEVNLSSHLADGAGRLIRLDRFAFLLAAFIVRQACPGITGSHP